MSVVRRSRIYSYPSSFIQQCFDEEHSKLAILNRLGISGGASYRTLDKYCEEFNISLEKFNENKRRYITSGIRHLKRKETSLGKILVKDSTYTNMNKLKDKLYKSGLKERVCEKCGLTSWCGEDIVLQIHHINGMHSDNRLENIQILCPNCHSQTNNFAGANNRKKESSLPLLSSNEIDFIKSHYKFRDVNYGICGLSKRFGFSRKTMRKIVDELNCIYKIN